MKFIKYDEHTHRKVDNIWFVDIEYPIPQIGYLMQGTLHHGNHAYDLRTEHYAYKHIRLGDAIEAPNCVDNEIEP